MKLIVKNISERLFNKFISGKRLIKDEFVLLEKLLNNSHHKSEIYHWLEENWQHSQPERVTLKFKQIRSRIIVSPARVRMNRYINVLSKAVAVLFIPLLVSVFYFYANQSYSAGLLTLATQKGEQTSVILPDGSKVWLNVDTKLSYPADYGENSRNIELVGEAYFEVEKNEELPFVVTSGKITTKALGTRFIISAYPDNSEIKSSLIEGSVDVKFGNSNKILKPGQQLIYNKNMSRVMIKSFDSKYALAWKNDQLVFRLAPFRDVISRLEKWFDIKIEYNPAQFKSETLTVRFEEYESLETILNVIAKANSFNYTIEDKVVNIKKIKRKLMNKKNGQSS